MNIFDQLLELSDLLRNDDRWLAFLEDYFVEFEVNSLHELIDKVTGTDDEDVLDEIFTEGEEILLIREAELDDFENWDDLEEEWDYED